MQNKLFLSYLAGFIDAEGCFTIHHVGGGSSPQKKYPRGEMHITSVEITLLSHIQSLLGGTLTQKKKRSNNHRQLYQYSLTGSSLLKNIPQFIDVLILKREQARLILSLLQTKQTRPTGIKLDPRVSNFRKLIEAELKMRKKASFEIDALSFEQCGDIPKEDLPYVAGFLDGDGSISLSRQAYKKKYTYASHVSFSNNNPLTLLWIANKTGGRVTPQKMKETDRTRPYELSLNKKQQHALLTQINPYLLVKKRTSDIVSQFNETSGYDDKTELYRRYKEEINKEFKMRPEDVTKSIYCV